MTRQEKWDLRFLNLAVEVSKWSKDPSTKVGSVIVDQDNRVLSLGYNGFPRGTSDSEDLLNNRAIKYERVIHGEVNAILNATRSVEGCTLYEIPFASCARCAAVVIQSGIRRVVYPIHDRFSPIYEKQTRWADSTEIAFQMFAEAGVELTGYDHSDVGIDWGKV